MNKYSTQFYDQISYLLKMRNVFNFDGNGTYLKKGKLVVRYSKDGMDGISAYFHYDSSGLIFETKHPNILLALIRTKSGLNFQIKEWAQGRADGTLPLYMFSKSKYNELASLYEVGMANKNRITIEEEFSLPEWVINAVENQKNKYY